MRIIKVPREDGSFDLEFAWDGGGGVDYLPAGGGSGLGESGYEGRTAGGPAPSWTPNPQAYDPFNTYKGVDPFTGRPILREPSTVHSPYLLAFLAPMAVDPSTDQGNPAAKWILTGKTYIGGVEYNVYYKPGEGLIQPSSDPDPNRPEPPSTPPLPPAPPATDASASAPPSPPRWAPPANGLGAATISPAGRPQPSHGSLGESRLAPAPQTTVPPFDGTTHNIIVTGKAPFEPEVSDPAVLEAIEGRAHLQWGDVKQFVKGGYNGLVNILPILAGPLLGPIVSEAHIPQADIDPRYGGAALVGEQLLENLALEGAAELPALGRALGSALKSERVISAVKAPAFWALGAGGLGGGLAKAARIEVELAEQTPVIADALWAEYQVYSTGSPVEQVFKVRQGATERQVLVDALTNSFLVEAKFGNLGQMWNPEREAFILKQAADYLLINDQLGLRGVRYLVSEALGAERLQSALGLAFPEAVASGKLSVWWVP